jgi:transcriptional regulator with XRE-family HTH domain
LFAGTSQPLIRIDRGRDRQAMMYPRRKLMTDIKSIVSTAVGGFDGNQAALALELGVTRATVSRWMSGQSIPDEGSCLRLAKITGHSATDVFRAAGRDTNLLPGDLESTVDADVQARVQQWARRLAGLSEANRSIVLSVVDDVVRTLSRRLGQSPPPTVLEIGMLTRQRDGDEEAIANADSSDRRDRQCRPARR